MAPTPLSISEVFNGMKEGAETHRPLLVRVTLIFAVLQAMTVTLELLGAAGIAVSYGLSLLLGTSYGGMVTAMLCLPGKAETPGELWASVRPVLSRLIWATLIFALVVAVGILLLIIPGLIILTFTAVLVQVIVVERLSVGRAFERSRELVTGNGWRVFGFLLLLALLSIVVAMLATLVALPFGNTAIGGAVLLFLIACTVNPIAALGPASLYNELVTSSPDRPESIEPLEPPR